MCIICEWLLDKQVNDAAFADFGRGVLDTHGNAFPNA